MSISNMLFDQVKNELEPFLERLFEGGAFGHLSHPYEDLDMTFGQMKQMVNSVLSGQSIAYEKIDGQQISFSWKNGRLIAARNKSQLRNRGEVSLTTDTISGFIGKSGNVPPAVINAFKLSMVDLEGAMSKLPPQFLQNMFQEGRFFMNSEIVARETANVIPYYKDYIVFHGLIEYDINGSQISEQMRQPGQQLENALKQVNATEQSKYSLKAANQVVLKNFKELPERREKVLSDLKQLQGKSPDSATLGQQQAAWWKDFIIKKSREIGYRISPEVLNMLVERWGLQERGVNTIPKITSKIDHEEFKRWVVEYDKEQLQQYEKNLLPFEIFFLRLGAEVLSNAGGFLSASPDKAVAELSNNIKNNAEKIKSGKDVEDLKKLKRQMERMEAIGNKNIAATEGIVFSMGGKLYKLTGLFAPINQISSILMYKKPTKQPVIEKILPVVEQQLATYDDLLREGGNVVFTNSTLEQKFLEPTIKNAFKIWGLTDVPYEIVGSKSKSIMGDVDVAIDSSDLGKKIGAKPVDRDVYWAKADAFFKSHIPKEVTGTPAYKLNKGLDQIHISAPIIEKEGSFIQIDLMLGDVGWMKDALSGTIDSRYKAVYRNQLLASILAHSHEPTKDPSIMKKYQINWKRGLQSVDIISKGGKIEKANLQPVSSNMNDVAKFLFGSDVTFNDINTFEKLFKQLGNPNFRYKHKKDEIIKSFNDDLVRMKLPPVEK